MTEFKNPQELVAFFNTLDLDKSTLVFKKDEAVKESKDCACGGTGACQCPTQVDESVASVAISAGNVLVESFSDDPSLPLSFDDEADENVFFVKEYEAIEGACGTGMVVLEDRTSYINMCEVDGKAKVDLTISVDGQRFTDVPFTVKTTNESPNLVLSKKHFNA